MVMSKTCYTSLTFRIDRMERGGSKTNLILYHFVSCLGSSSAEPGVIFGRLLKKVNLYTCTCKVEMQA